MNKTTDAHHLSSSCACSKLSPSSFIMQKLKTAPFLPAITSALKAIAKQCLRIAAAQVKMANKPPGKLLDVPDKF